MNKKLKYKNLFNANKAIIIAEISTNHGGKISNLRKLIKNCKQIGVDAIKIQTYEADDLTLNSNNLDFKIDNKSPWKKYKNMWNLYNVAKTPHNWLKKIFEIANKEEILLFSSPFSERSVDLLEKFNCPIYKLASPEINHIPLIEKISKTNKPIIISTGLANDSDIKLAIKTFRKYNSNQIILLKCTTEYPCSYNSVNLKHITEMKQKYKVDVGLSDHTLGIEIPIAAVAMGARVIEKHICLDKKINTPDNFFSLDINEFKKMIASIRNVEQSINSVALSNFKISRKKLLTRRSIYFSKKLKKNQVITKDSIKIIRPGKGIEPKFLNKIIGMKVSKNINFGDRVTLSSVKKK